MEYRRCAALYKIAAHKTNDRPIRILSANNIQLFFVSLMKRVIFTNDARDRKNPLLP